MYKKSPHDQANWIARLTGYDIYLEVWNSWDLKDWMWESDKSGMQSRFPHRRYWFGPFHIIVGKLAWGL